MYCDIDELTTRLDEYTMGPSDRREGQILPLQHPEEDTDICDLLSWKTRDKAIVVFGDIAEVVTRLSRIPLGR